MNKLLTTLILLCLPVSSFADIWFCTSIRAIAEELNRKGTKPKKTAQWNPSSVHKVANRVA